MFIYGFLLSVNDLAYNNFTHFYLINNIVMFLFASVNLYLILYISTKKVFTWLFVVENRNDYHWFNYRITIYLSILLAIIILIIQTFSSFVNQKVLIQGGTPKNDVIIGQQYFQGRLRKKNYIQAYSWWKKAADLGYAPAESLLGLCYSHGYGVPQDASKALYWYGKSADQGDSFAEFRLGLAYLTGKKWVNQDKDKGFAYIMKSAQGGFAPAEGYIGYEYFRGIHYDKNLSVANAWFEKAAKQGNPYAEYQLAKDYYWGTGIDQSPMKALHWWKKAAAQGGPLGKKAEHDIEVVEHNSSLTK